MPLTKNHHPMLARTKTDTLYPLNYASPNFFNPTIFSLTKISNIELAIFLEPISFTEALSNPK